MTTPAPARPSSTVLIVRDGRSGIEVFMVGRERQVDFASGVLVFPGGKVDPDDHAEVWPHIAPPTAPDHAYWIAAVRETFEESGLLIARRADTSKPVSAVEAAAVASRFRTPLLDGATTFSAIAREAGIEPDFSAMVPFAHWITPVTIPKRFETHFFLVSAHDGQVAEHDGREAVRSFWIRPQDLLADVEAGRQSLVPATKANIEMLGESDTVANAMTASRQRTIVPVMPVMEKVEGGMRLTIRKDAGYKTTEVMIRR
jgi:8-oxo-dGTP pyrophosphatase MutT (NUDIX family)